MSWDHEPPTNPPYGGGQQPPWPPPTPPAPPSPPAPPAAPSAGPSSWEPTPQPMNPYATSGAPTPPPQTPHHAAPKRRRPMGRVLVALIVLLGLFGIGFGVRSLLVDDTTVIARPSSISASGGSASTAATIDPGLEPVAAVAATVSPSVVQIETTNGLGSGVVYDTGLVMTNAHVIGTAKQVTVRDSNGKAVKGEVLGADTGTDIAVVRATGLSAPVAALADSLPKVGQITVAIGSPYGLSQTVTSGIVSAVNRPVDNDKGVVVSMIQTDASINPGNSGGALANIKGQIIGINTAIFSQTGENTGIGFAIPITTAKRTADKIASGQSTAKAGLGLTGPSSTPNGDAGAYVQSVTSGGAADKAGIKAGDIITGIDGTQIRSFDELRGVVSSYSPGDKVVVTINRDGQPKDITVTLGTLGK